VADSRSAPASLFNTVRRLIGLRRHYPAFAWGDLTWVETEAPAVAAFWRSHAKERLLIVNNLSGKLQAVQVPGAGDKGGTFQDLITGREYTQAPNRALEVALEPYQYLWLKAGPMG